MVKTFFLVNNYVEDFRGDDGIQVYVEPKQPGGAEFTSRFPAVFPDSSLKRFSCFIKDSGASLSDFLEVASIGQHQIISKKAKNILDRFDLRKSRFYPADVYNSNGIKLAEYYVLWTIPDLWLDIDFAKSSFGVLSGKLSSSDRTEIQLDNIQSFEKEVRKRKRSFRLGKMVLNPSISFNVDVGQYDVIKVGRVSNGCFFSSDLKKEIEEEGLTGITFLRELRVEFSTPS